VDAALTKGQQLTQDLPAQRSLDSGDELEGRGTVGEQGRWTGFCYGERSCVQGLGGALFEAITFDDGKILNGRLSKYRVPRFSDVPVLETVLLDRKDLPSAGAGECPMIGLAPAIAIFDADWGAVAVFAAGS
jgi:hypothetical protein